MSEAHADDDGGCPPLLANALAARSALAVAAAVSRERLLIPVVKAPAGSLPEDDTDPCGTGEAMASVTLVTPDGRRALLAFSSLATLGEWDAEARPLPQPGAEVVRSALAAGLDAVLIDVASGHRVALSGRELAIAAGR